MLHDAQSAVPLACMGLCDVEPLRSRSCLSLQLAHPDHHSGHVPPPLPGDRASLSKQRALKVSSLYLPSGEWAPSLGPHPPQCPPLCAWWQRWEGDSTCAPVAPGPGEQTAPAPPPGFTPGCSYLAAHLEEGGREGVSCRSPGVPAGGELRRKRSQTRTSAAPRRSTRPAGLLTVDVQGLHHG